jgi:diacylglycerol kinase (ATP)
LNIEKNIQTKANLNSPQFIPFFTGGVRGSLNSPQFIPFFTGGVRGSSWAIIINPKAGKKKYRQQRLYLFQTLRKAGITFDYKVTRFAGHAIKIAKMYAEKDYQNFMVLGGDGTMSEVINGIFSANIKDTSNIKIALIPRGTGNDWGRFWGLTNDYKHSIDVFLKGKTQHIDIGKVEYELEGNKETHFFINSVGFGLDATVVNITHRLKEIFGSHSFMYTVSLLRAVFTYKSNKVKLYFDGKSLHENMFTMNVANGCYSGGGMKQTPYALPYDGLLDVMMAKKPTFFDIIGGLRRLFNGKLLEHPIIESFQTQSILVDCHENALMEADGIIVNGDSPYHISIIPNGIKMVVPEPLTPNLNASQNQKRNGISPHRDKLWTEYSNGVFRHSENRNVPT